VKDTFAIGILRLNFCSILKEYLGLFYLPLGNRIEHRCLLLEIWHINLSSVHHEGSDDGPVISPWIFESHGIEKRGPTIHSPGMILKV
jgi:hypothetical protein